MAVLDTFQVPLALSAVLSACAARPLGPAPLALEDKASSWPLALAGASTATFGAALRAVRARPAAAGLLEAMKAGRLEPSLVERSLALATWQEALELLPGGDLMAYSGAMTACLPRWPWILEIQEQMMARRRVLAAICHYRV